MKQFKSLFKDTFIYGLSGIISSFISIFLIPLYTKVFEPADYGVISILTTTSAFLNILLIFSLDNSAAVWFWDKPDEKERKVTFNSWLVFLAGTGLVAMLIVVAFSSQLSLLFFDTKAYSLLFILIGLNLLFVGFQKVVNIWCRMLHQPLKAMTYSLILLATTLCFNIVFILYLRIGVQGVFYSQLIAGFMGFIFMLLLLGKWVQPGSFSYVRLKDMLRFSLPLVPASLLYWVMNMASIYFLKLLVKDNAEIGLYQVGASISNILSLVTWAFFQAWTPFALSISKEENARRTYSKVFEWYCVLGFSCAFLLLFFAKDILIIFTRESYIDAWQIIGLLAINVVMMGVPNILAIANSIAKNNISYAVSMPISALVTVILFFMLIPQFGKEGAALAMIVGNIVMCIILTYKAQRLYFIPYNFKRIILFFLLCTLVFSGMLQLNLNLLEKIGIAAVLFAGLLLVFRKKVKELLPLKQFK
ncbi:lipopolysaccharide biosynthesis protein [Adhaeribacter soli]|uniref:Oligosaccharide flippase family protein n=1 Tax=Adhaeribacter soli TaxID=2607655 RepID=A0A5N1IL40_9BACT|nr:oligosaccharide flippase family protein [Adhaeribacter soli]KAA9327401.1 oligosaccharide flippase family protein [Adhaeribacter soli]